MAQAPRIGMFSVGDPSAYADIGRVNLDCTGSPLIAQAAQAIAEASHVVFRQAAMAAVMKHEAKKLRRLAAR